ncbi:hypothetical protein D3C78_1969260 [compost metagenome]
MVEQLLMEALGLFTRVKEQAVLRSTHGAEVVGVAAHGDDQSVVVQGTFRHQLVPDIVEGSR